jgi:hypothetical protein
VGHGPQAPALPHASSARGKSAGAQANAGITGPVRPSSAAARSRAAQGASAGRHRQWAPPRPAALFSSRLPPPLGLSTGADCPPACSSARPLPPLQK